MKSTVSLSILLSASLARGAVPDSAPDLPQHQVPLLLQHELCRNGKAAQTYRELTGDQISEIHTFFNDLESLKSNFELAVCEHMSASPAALEFLKKIIESDYLKISMLLEISGADSSEIAPEHMVAQPSDESSMMPSTETPQA